MNLRQLEYFICVAECLNFTKAAKKCFISQTAITLQIKSLEERVGVPLFIRDKHHVELTPAGKVYLEEARTILARSEEAVKLARSTAEGFSGTITVGFIRGYEQSLFSETLRSFHDAYPNISFKLMRDNMSALYNNLIDGDCDIAFNLSPYLQSYPKLSHHFLKSYQVMAILYPGHPLADRKYVTYKDLAHEDFIIMQPQGRPNDEAEEVMICYNRGGFVPNIVAREREVQTLLLMVSAAMGIAILPEYAVRYFHDAKNLVVVPILKKDHEQETLDFEISWLPDNQNPVIEKLLKWMEIREYRE